MISDKDHVGESNSVQVCYKDGSSSSGGSGGKPADVIGDADVDGGINDEGVRDGNDSDGS